MKKYVKFTVGYIIALFVAGPVFAGLVTHNDYTSGSTISATGQNTNENNIISAINGNLDSTNLANGAVTAAKIQTNTITEDRFATVVQSSFDYVYSTVTLPSNINGRVTTLETNSHWPTTFVSSTSAVPGYQVMPDSFTIQWGSATFTTSQAITFPRAFTTAAFAVNATIVSGSTVSGIIAVQSVTRTGFTLVGNKTDGTLISITAYWTAIGY